MSSTQSSDPIVRFVSETIGDIGGTKSGGARSGTKPDEARFFPSVLPVGAMAAVAVYSAEVASALPAAATPVQSGLHLVGHWYWQVLLVAGAIAAAVFDLLRLQARRHRRTVRNQVSKTTHVTPVAIRVALLPGKLPPKLWRAGVRTPRRIRIRLEGGTVVDSTNLSALRTAVQDSAGPRWDMQVRWDPQQWRLLIFRSRADTAPTGSRPDTTSGARSSRHRSLETALSRSPLRDAEVKPLVDADEQRPEHREIGYTVDFTTALGVGRKTAQIAIEEAARPILGEHPSGRMWKFMWQLGPGSGGDLGGEKARLRIELQDSLPTRVNHTPPDLEGVTGHRFYAVAYAVGAGGKRAFWDISWKSNVPHALVIGPTGGGKTTTIRALITEVVLRGVCVLAIDPKKIELDGMENWPGVTAVVYTLQEACELISAVWAEMHARLDWVHSTKMPNTTLPIFVFVADELFILSQFIQRAMKSPDKELADSVKEHDPLGKLADIAALIRSAGGRRLDGVQRPDAAIYGDAGGNARDNYGTRISHAKLSPNGAYMMWGDSNIGREVDTSIPGRGIATDERGDPMDVQVVWTPDVDEHPNKWSRLGAEDRAIVTGLRPEKAPVFTAYSAEMRLFLKQLKRPYEMPARIDGSGTPDAEKVLARELHVGDRLHHVDDDGVTKVTGIISKVQVTDTCVLVDLVSDGRPRWQAEYRLNQFVKADRLDEQEPEERQ